MSASGDWGPAPLGVDLNETQTAKILSPVIAFMVLGVLAVVGRLVSRLKSGSRIAIDDYLVVVSLVSSKTGSAVSPSKCTGKSRPLL